MKNRCFSLIVQYRFVLLLLLMLPLGHQITATGVNLTPHDPTQHGDDGACNADAQLTLSGATNGTHYNFIAGSDITGDAADIANATAFDPGTDLPLKISSTLADPNGTQDYTSRVFNDATACFVDVTVTLNEKNCNTTCSLSLSYTATSCAESAPGSGMYVTTYDITASWVNPPATGDITLTLIGDGTLNTTTIPAATIAGGSSTTLVGALTVPADGAGTTQVDAVFAADTACKDSFNFKAPVPCVTNLGFATGEACNNLTAGQVGGSAWEDWDCDGTMDESTFVGVAGVQVRLTGCNGTDLGSTYTDANGNWTFNISAAPSCTGGNDVRVEYVLPESVSCWAKPTQMGTDNGTTVQFVDVGDCASLGLSSPSDYCQEEPKVAVSCYENGSGEGNANPALVSYSYFASGIPMAYGGTAENPVNDATLDQLGTVWGTALQKKGQRLFLSAVMKRHSGLGSRGTDGIYIMDYSGATPALAGGFDMQGVTPGNGGAAIDLGTLNRTHITGPITAGAAGDFELPSETSERSRDLDAFGKVGKVGFGDIDMGEDGHTLWMVNLNQRAIISVDVSGATGSLPGVANQYLLANLPGVPNCTGGVFRPWGLGFHKGRGYLGGMCTAEESQNTDDLVAYVLSFDPNNVAAGFREELSFAMDYIREEGSYSTNGGGSSDPCDFYAWANDWADTGLPTSNLDFTSIYPQPILSDIDFADEGSMVLGIADRWGHQGGFQNIIPVSGSTATTTFYSTGDILHACRSGNGFTLEGTAGCSGNDNSPNGPAEYQDINDGPNGVGEYYPADEFHRTSVPSNLVGHYEITLGALGILRGANEVYSTVFDPIVDPEVYGTEAGAFTQGIHIYNTSTGAKDDAYTIIDFNGSFGDPGNQGKTTGLGDLAFICDPAPLEIGNYVWCDSIANGTQDAGERGINGILVQLYDRNGGLVGQDTTTNQGQYFFNQNNVDSTGITVDGSGVATPMSGNYTGMSFTTQYFIVFGGGQFTSGKFAIGSDTYGITSMVNAGSNDNVDSDVNGGSLTAGSLGARPDGLPFIDMTTEATGCGDHKYDLGLTCTPVSLGSTVFQDNNNNGVQNTGENGIPGVLVIAYLDGGDGATNGTDDTPVVTGADGIFDTADDAFGPDGISGNADDGQPGMLTNASGNYYFSGLTAGDYYVQIPASVFGSGAGLENIPISSNTANGFAGETDPDDNADNDDEGLQTGGSGTVTTSQIISLAPGGEPTDADTETAQGNDQDNTHDNSGNMTLDFGFFAPVSLGDTTFVDTDMDGLHDAGEPGLEGATVTLYNSTTGMPVITDAEGNPITGTTMTNAMGFYEFTNLSPGNYYVVFDLSTVPGNEFIAFTTPTGGNEANDSDADPTTGQTESTGDIASGNRFADLDAGVVCIVAAEAGTGRTICASANIDLSSIGASITPSNVTGFGATWTTSGNGTFDDGNAGVYGTAMTYTPGAAEKASGQVTLTLTTSDPMAAPFNSASCGPASDQVTFMILKVDCGTYPWNEDD